MDYKNAGVDIEAGYESVELMKKFVKGIVTYVPTRKNCKRNLDL